jgi:hypothetical protein
MTPLMRMVLVLGLAGALAGCGGGRSAAVPHAPGATPSPTPVPGSAPASAAGTALQGAQTIFQSLPHTSVTSDLNALAAQMVSSGTFATATVVPGGISATLPNGTPTLVFGDRLGNLSSATASIRRTVPSAVRPLVDTLGPANTHQIAFLINTIPGNPPAFTPARQQAFADAFSAALGSAPGYAADDLDVSLENIVALGTSHPLDFLDIATHGLVGGASPNIVYYWLSTTQDNGASETTYAADIAAGRVVPAIALTLSQGTTFTLPSLAFTPNFLTAHVTFNPGAIVDNESCFGQSPLIAVNVQGILQAAGVGRYYGWTKEVDGGDADETDAFLFDRLLGEQSPGVTGLDTFVNQLTPPQRPFPLDQVDEALASETRSSKIQSAQNESYLVSDKGFAVNNTAPPIGDGTKAKMIITDFGGESLTNAPIEYGLPSIEQMQVAETPSAGTLTILGAFPTAQGIVQITDTNGVHALPVTSWATNNVVATLPAGGSGSAGMVQVLSTGGQPGNSVPLTQWTGQLTYTENDDIPNLGGQSGSGSGTIQAVYNLVFRSDVHPTVSSIDTPAQPQNLYFNGPQAVSIGHVTAFTGTFTTDDGTKSATFSTNAGAPPLLTGIPPLPPSTFDIGAVTGQPASCNNASPGPQAGPTNVFCPGTGFVSQGVGSCSDTDGTLCPSGSLSGFGSPKVNFSFPGMSEGGLIVLTMDPTTYAISVTSVPGMFVGGHFGGTGRPSTASVTGTIGAPVSPPPTTTPASRRRAPRSGLR